MADFESDARQCHHCKAPGTPGADLFPYLVEYGPGGNVHHWMHQGCSRPALGLAPSRPAISQDAPGQPQTAQDGQIQPEPAQAALF